MRTRGFTLIELLIVVMILAILAALLFPVFARAREKARGVTCGAHLRQIGTAATMYRSDHDDLNPPACQCGGPGGSQIDWPWTLAPYHRNVALFLCPTRPAWKLDGGTPTDPTDDARDSGAYLLNRYLSDTTGQRTNPCQNRPAHEADIDDPVTTLTLLDAAGDDQRDAVTLDWEDPENQRHSGGINALWFDGHVKWSPPGKLVDPALWALP
ncbi:MAG: hypothetical protein COZ06_04175 [Armatimonadetes bacterium CG_4_10_14_3_um_filter_66_18]|nr:DUF1559 domain-containing protein [Armatimonadota bacterium]OIP10263.1 MAG: hypothetical protein AUJ96_04000 [Armatimonadetes bacterium CG2_30_66_41]PIW15471.1 MAG: hypothetical protein COW34_06805 [Armatimonadetes bacterium CG17_big_fil_post_rev_8_21_14_2_50_66_6]PIX46537.1 MAG: hypothetical protein COZ57_11510 [Armatimonadetes bacterium CG_4_8_14_3_um_filter_66_20]PIY51738.1 MAG: hypothetical protein COZ06_04175 [Armatimonadetes bacterium CG_4_10_14_3_um_filter_66_18]PJB69340.1 MAG: hypot